MKRWICLFACLLFACAASSAMAAPTKIGQFKDAGIGEYELGLVTNNGEAGKEAGLVMLDPSGDYPNKIVMFVSRDEWKRFLSLWERARETTKPANGKEIKIGSVDDNVSNSSVDVDMSDDGDIEITMTDKVSVFPFIMERRDVAVFDQDVRKVSAFFKK